MRPPRPARLLCSKLRNIRSLAANSIDKPVILLCYHRIAAGTSDINSVSVLPDNFRAHIDYLKQHFRIVRFEEKWEHARKPAIVITFDDGYADNLTEALPVLERAELPATFFISTGNIGTGNELWWDALERMVLAGRDYPPHFTLESSPVEMRPTVSDSERAALYRELHSLFMMSTAAQRTSWLRQIQEWSGAHGARDGTHRLLTEDELRFLANSRWVTIGAHTVTHPQLSTLSEDEQRYEIVESKRQLEKLIGKRVKVFAYPFGKKTDYNPTSVRICREAGYLKAAAAFRGEAHRWTDPFQIPRHFVYNWDADEFAFRLKRLWV